MFLPFSREDWEIHVGLARFANEGIPASEQ